MRRRDFLTTLVKAGLAAAVAVSMPVPQIGTRTIVVEWSSTAASWATREYSRVSRSAHRAIVRLAEEDWPDFETALAYYESKRRAPLVDEETP